jgi:HicB family.
MSKNKTQTSLRINKNIYQKATEEAQKIGISLNSYITMVLLKELQNK